MHACIVSIEYSRNMKWSHAHFMRQHFHNAQNFRICLLKKKMAAFESFMRDVVQFW